MIETPQWLTNVGAKWLAGQTDELTDSIERMTPVEFNETYRYLPQSVSKISGYISYDLTPYWAEIVNCMDVRSPVREVTVMKGVQLAYTTSGIEAPLFYVAGHLKTLPVMFATADRDLAGERIENNIIPMFQHSGLDVFQSSDIGNTRKTGKTRNHLQWVGGGYMIPLGANNMSKIRTFSMMYVFMDEIDAEDWLGEAKGGGDKIKLFKDRAQAFWESRKIMMGSSPLLVGSSRVEKEFNKGDRRVYKCRCLKCGYPQNLRWSGKNKETGKDYGFAWDYNDEGQVDKMTVRYRCKNCGEPHFEYDKVKLIHKGNAHWEPTATPVDPDIRSYHLPAFLAPPSLCPWYKHVLDWHEAMDVEAGRVKDVNALQKFYNNSLGVPFEGSYGGRVDPKLVSGFKRRFYNKGDIVNKRIEEFCDSGIVFLTCTVDVHHDNLAVAIWGWSTGMVSWLVDYFRIYDEAPADQDKPVGCESTESPVWVKLQTIVEESVWRSDDGKTYRLTMTLIDSGWANATVTAFCSQYASNVYPILGRDRPAKNQTIKEFAEFTTQMGTVGYRVLSDYYKDRLLPVLRREWHPEGGKQPPYTFNAPWDTTDAELKELAAERRKEKVEPTGLSTFFWYRPPKMANELWDLLVYAHASVEILAKQICIDNFEMENVDWDFFWKLGEDGTFYGRD